MRLSFPALIAVIALSTLFSVTLTRLIDSPASAARAVNEPHTDAPIAVCSILEITEELMNTDRFRPAREAEEQRLTASLQDIRQRITALSEQLRGAARDDPEFADERQQFSQLMGEFQQRQSIAQQQLEMFVVGQFREAYDMAKSSARAVAKEKGFTYLIASTPPDKEIIENRPMDVVRNDMFQRPVLMAPEGTDINDDVRADLNLF